MTGFAVRMLLVLAVLALLPLQGARAAPRNGIGLGVDLTWHSFLLPYAPTDVEFTSAGLGLTVDAQFVWTDSWSINPALLLSIEKTLYGPEDWDVLSYGTLLQVRYWVGNAFLAGHSGILIEVLRSEVQTLSTRGGVVGVAAGYEPGNGLIFNLQLDWERFEREGTILGARFLFGFRWY